jgi:flavin reductase (DIM6/NTAB) family NADH-FMN oxidoreductase RutF
MDVDAKRAVFRMFTYGLYALTVPSGDEGHGATVNWCMQTSFDPPMVGVSVEKASRTIGLLRQSHVFAVNVYSAEQRDLAGRLGRRFSHYPDKFRGITWSHGPTGAPVLLDALGWIECRVRGEADSGDSVVFIGEVVSAGVGGKQSDPLTMSAAGFRHAG